MGKDILTNLNENSYSHGLTSLFYLMHPIMAIIYCPICEQPITGDASNCRFCGLDLRQLDAASEEATPEEGAQWLEYFGIGSTETSSITDVGRACSVCLTQVSTNMEHCPECGSPL